MAQTGRPSQENSLRDDPNFPLKQKAALRQGFVDQDSSALV